MPAELADGGRLVQQQRKHIHYIHVIHIFTNHYKLFIKNIEVKYIFYVNNTEIFYLLNLYYSNSSHLNILMLNIL